MNAGIVDLELESFESALEMMKAYGPWLERDPARHNLLLGNLYRYGKREKNEKLPQGLLMMGIRDTEQKRLAFLQSGQQDLMIAAEEQGWEAALEFVMGYFKTHFNFLNGVVGTGPVTLAFAEAFGVPYRLDFKQAIMQTSAIIAPIPCAGKIRPATINDIELLSAWVVAFFKESLNHTIANEQAETLIRGKVKDKMLWVWDKNGVVAMAANDRPTRRGITISLVYTPPEFRGHGFASNIVAKMTTFLLTKGNAFCCLHTNLEHPTSNKIYRSLGFSEVCRGDKITFLYPSSFPSN